MRLRLGPGEDLVAAIRAADAESLTVIIPPTLDAVALALAKAVIGPLAVERAPGTRVNAVALGAGHVPEDAEAAVAFLEAAPSTTGQIFEVT